MYKCFELRKIDALVTFFFFQSTYYNLLFIQTLRISGSHIVFISIQKGFREENNVNKRIEAMS